MFLPVAAGRILTLFALLAGLFVDKVYGRSVAVIFEQAVKLQRKHPLEQIFLREPVELAAHSGEIFHYLFVIHLHLLYPVGQIIELLLDDMLRSGHLLAFESLADFLFYLTQLALLA